MGGQRIKPDDEGIDSNGSVPSDFIKVFHEQCPYYMAIGMTYDEYWNGDASLPRYYIKAFEIKRKMRNEELWLQGQYVYDALLMASPILHAFAKKGTMPAPYHEYPYPLTQKDADEINRMKEKKKMQAEIEKMKLRAQAWNELFAAKGGNENA